ncbi:hypothetical protein QE152_g13507 [Popillia japonica]|uniref:Uncharacterized protein n=1 Tax=Popillia japonica TaxID=7064 RepID=A0AAW1LD51_POPJA
MAVSITHHQQLFNVKSCDGMGYSTRECRVKLLLEQAEVIKIVNDDPPRETSPLYESFSKNDIKARNIIVQCIIDTLEGIYSKKGISTTAKGIIDTLEGIYSKKGISTQVQLQRKLTISLRFVEGTSLNIFLTEFQQTICELKGAGGRIEESEIISQLLSAMPESYQAVTTALDVMFCQDETKGYINNEDSLHANIVNNYNPGIICLAETHITSDIEEGEISMDGYRMERCDTENNRTGGVLIGVFPVCNIDNLRLTSECFDWITHILKIDKAGECVYLSYEGLQEFWRLKGVISTRLALLKSLKFPEFYKNMKEYLSETDGDLNNEVEKKLNGVVSECACLASELSVFSLKKMHKDIANIRKGY